MNVRKELFKYKDEKFRKFESNLTQNLDIKNIAGVKSHRQKQIAKELYKSGKYKYFIEDVPHKYLEENLVYVHLISLLKDYDECMYALKKILPYIDNWVVSDSVSLRTFEKNKEKLLKFINKCLSSKKTYVIRVGIIF